MKELILNGRTYLSTKRAAENTGYTKDYVGQLARGGKVSAQQVGRNWYVDAEAIKKHKFGDFARITTQAEEMDDTPAPELDELVGQTEEEDADEATEKVTLHKHVEETVTQESPVEESADPVQEIESAWKEWYRAQRTVPDDNDEVFLSFDERMEVSAPQEGEQEESEEEIEEEVPLHSGAPQTHRAATLNLRALEEEEDEPEEENELVAYQSTVPAVRGGGAPILAVTAFSFFLIVGLIVGGGYVAIKSDIEPVATIAENTANFFLGTTTFER